MKFDAYAGNVRGMRPEQVAELLSFGSKGRVSRGAPRGRHLDVWQVEHLPVDGSIWVGHDRELDAAYFEVKGATTPPAVETLRRHFPDAHTVSRLDSCEDYDAPGAYRQLVKAVDSCCDPRVKSHAWQPRGKSAEVDGATTYWGSTQSRVRVRCYEAGKHPDRVRFNRPEWARVEAQIRPGKAKEKALAASVSALDAWGFSRWSKAAAELLAHVPVQRFAPELPVGSFDKTTLYIARTFRRHLEEMLADFGNGDCVFEEFKSIWVADEEAASKTRP